MDMDIKQSPLAPASTNISPQAGAPIAGRVKLLIIVLVVIAIVAFVWYYPVFRKDNITPEEKSINKQIEELDKLRDQAGARVYSEKELQEQAKELDAMRKTTIGPDGKPVKVETKVPTEAEIQKQVDELDALRRR